MFTLSQILSENPAPSSDMAHIQFAANCSPFVARLLNKDATLLADLLQNLTQAYQYEHMQMFLDVKINQLNNQKIDVDDTNQTQLNTHLDEITLKRLLRQLRQSVMARMIVRDLNQLADDIPSQLADDELSHLTNNTKVNKSLANLNEVMQTTSNLAEISLRFAISHLMANQIPIYGAPVGINGNIQELIVVAMGKLGGGELNVSSDIDLIFAYEEEGTTNGDKPITNQDFFTRLAKKLIAVMDEVTEDGFVFRVDMRLRPYGSEGVLVSCLDALEDYYQNNGREWERYAWIKGRVVAGNSKKITVLLKPFVFRKYLDYGAFASMRDLKVQIQRDVIKRSLQDNIKLGRGGIREIEFIAQVFQLIRGGQDTSLQIKPTLKVLRLLQNKSLLEPNVVCELTEAYVFLRNLEHRLMYVEDQQTQDLPKNSEAQSRIATSMIFADWTSFLVQLEQHRQRVQQHFDAVFQEQKSLPQDTASSIKSDFLSVTKSTKDIWLGLTADDEAIQFLSGIGYKEAIETLNRLHRLHASAKYQQLPTLSRQRFDALIPSVIALAANASNADITLLRVSDLMESICRRASYLALLAEYPTALHIVTKLLSASPWLANYLTQHPILLDELLDTNSLYATPDFVLMRQELANSLQSATGDVERQMDLIRHFKNAATFRFAAKDVAGNLALETLSDYLSELADLILQQSLTTVWQNLKVRHCETPKFAVIGYGKLGGKELGYASDLDIIFLYEDDAAEASDVYAKFAQRINNWFNSLTNAGILYETDLQLRPDGNSGLLVSSVAAFRDYQLKKAWVWEHQAITRARFIAGDAQIGQAFEQIRHEVLSQPRESKKLGQEVMAMREKMREAHPAKVETFDLKHDHGGIIDVEFLVQFLVLNYAGQYPQLNANCGNIALLKLCASLQLIDGSLAEQVANAYREYRQLQHATRLQGANQAKVDYLLVAPYCKAVIALWHAVFADEIR